jgi:outer membrane protein, heavy metal efflux system
MLPIAITTTRGAKLASLASPGAALAAVAAVAAVVAISSPAGAQPGSDGAAPPGAPSTQPMASAPPAGVFVPRASLELVGLTRLVARRSAQVQTEQLNLDLAGAEVQQSRLLNNPVLDAGWGTIPIGTTNPSDLPSPMLNVPNYSLGVSYTFPLGKRGPRLRRAQAMEQGARASVTATARAEAIELSRTLGALATTNMRIEGLRGLIEQGKVTISLAKSRLDAGFGTPLDVDRLELELSRVEQQVLSNESDSHAALANCASMVGTQCGPFSDGAEARAFLSAWIVRAEAAGGSIEERPDIRALDAQRRAAAAEADWARAQAIPDPTVRVGYVYDTFLISGAQRHSLNLSLSLPLPLFDRGQAQVRAAEARRTRLEAQRSRIVETARVRAESLRRALGVQQRRVATISDKMLPRARAVLADLERAANNRLLPFTDVIPARRTVNELLIDEADSFGDAFQTAVELLAITSEPPHDAAEQPAPESGGVAQ